MLSMLLLLAAAPQTAVPVLPDGLSASAPQTGGPMLRVVGQTPALCRSQTTQAVDPISPGAGLMWRDQGHPVALYRLLDRYVDGCPAPIVVNYQVPGSNAVGREMLRDATPVTIPRP